MALSKREKYIAFAVGGAVALYGLDQTVLQPFKDKLDAIQAATDDANGKLVDRAALFTQQRELSKVWADMTKNGLSTDPSAAESQAQLAVIRWAGESGARLQSIGPTKATDEKQFQTMGFHVTAQGDTPSVGRLLWDLETASVPVRVTDIQVTPLKEGTDNLTINFGVSTLCILPGAGVAKPAPAPAAASDGGNAT